VEIHADEVAVPRGQLEGLELERYVVLVVTSYVVVVELDHYLVLAAVAHCGMVVVH
jgi:hypothetical protein